MLEEELVDIKIEEHFDASSNNDTAENACSDMKIKVEDFDDNVELYDAVVIKEEEPEDSATDISKPEATAQGQAVKNNAAASNQLVSKFQPPYDSLDENSSKQELNNRKKFVPRILLPPCKASCRLKCFEN